MAPRQWTCGYCCPVRTAPRESDPRSTADARSAPGRIRKEASAHAAPTASAWRACPSRAGDRAIKNPPRRASRVRDSGCCRVFARETLPVSTVVCVRAEGCVVLRVVSLSRLTRFRRSCLLGAKPNHGFFDCQQPPPRKSVAYVAAWSAEGIRCDVPASRATTRDGVAATHAIAKNTAFSAFLRNDGACAPHRAHRRAGRRAAPCDAFRRRAKNLAGGSGFSRRNSPIARKCANSAPRERHARHVERTRTACRRCSAHHAACTSAMGRPRRQRASQPPARA